MEPLLGDVLFIGDNRSMRELIIASLERVGRKVLHCSRQEASALLKKRAFDLLILNWIDEPGRDAEAYRELCHLAPISQAYLFVGLSASQTAQQAIRLIGEERILPLTLASLMESW